MGRDWDKNAHLKDLIESSFFEFEIMQAQSS